MATVITNSTLFNSFAVFRELLQGINGFTSLSPTLKFTEDTRYFEDEPNPKSRSFPGYPVIVISTEAEQESLTMTKKKMMNYTTEVMIQIDYHAEKDNNLLNSYMGAIVEWFNKNKSTLRYTYGLWGLSDIEKERDSEIVGEKRIIVGTLRFDYHVTLDMTA